MKQKDCDDLISMFQQSDTLTVVGQGMVEIDLNFFPDNYGCMFASDVDGPSNCIAPNDMVVCRLIKHGNSVRMSVYWSTTSPRDIKWWATRDCAIPPL